MHLSEQSLIWGSERSAIRELAEYGRKRKEEIGEDKVFDFSLGNPAAPLPEQINVQLMDLIGRIPGNILHGYTSSAGDRSVRLAIADYIRDRFDFTADPDLIYISTGSAASLAMVFKALTGSPEDEFICFSPYFPEYEVFLKNAGAKLVLSPCLDGSFQPDPADLKNRISPNTRSLIINQPCNPTGVIFSEENISAILRILETKEKEYGHPIYLISDEPYRDLSYNREPPYFPGLYKNTIVIYSYSKVLTLAGERIGYLSVSPKADFAQEVYRSIAGAGRGMGYVCAPSLFQYLIRDCQGLTSDLSFYKRNRDRLYKSLCALGYEAVYPDGAFYLFVRSPLKDAQAFTDLAKKYELLLVPSDSFGCKGYVRISYCVAAEVIEKSLPAFAALARDLGLRQEAE